MTLYIPPHFREADQDRALRLIAAYPFALLLAHGSEPVLSHLPLRIVQSRPLCLEGHVARANPAADAVLSGGRFTAVFTGPHSYVSPTWYRSPGMVPTWNFAAVHATGHAEPVTGRGALGELVESLSDVFERNRPQPWIPDYDDSMLDAIVGFRMAVEQLEVKFKLSQNRSAADRDAVVEALQAGDREARAVALLMRESGGS